MASHGLLVTLRDVSYFYPHAAEPALRDVSLDVARGELLGVIGPTGAGKSTLCQLFNGIVPQFYGGRFFGRVTIAGLDTLETPVSRLAAHVGLVFEDPEIQLTATSVENEIAFALENLSVPRAEIRTRITWALESVGLAGYERRHPHTLSGGQKQRLAIAAALALHPALLVLDEPASQLDPAGASEVFAVLSALNREAGVTVVIASHAVEALAEHADRIALLAEGALLAVGTPEAIFADVEKLERHHLRPPQVTETFARLGERGVPVPPALPVRLEPALAAARSLRPRLSPAPLPPAPEARPKPEALPLIAVRGLRYRYEDGVEALRGVELEIHRGEYVLLAGRNGAGKSTLLRQCVGLLKPTAGSVEIEGRTVQELPVAELARRVGYVAQNPDRQLFAATVAEEVAFALHLRGMSAAEVEARVEASLAALGLLDQREAHPLSLPRGDRARVVIAAVLAMGPEILIFDEPTTGQDVQSARAILEVTRALHRAGKTLIVVTHHLHLMPGYAERIVVLTGGAVALDAPLRSGYHAFEQLRQSDLEPPQAVLLGRALCPDAQLLTPEEVAGCVSASQQGARA